MAKFPNFYYKGDVLLGDVYLSVVDNVLPSIEAAFVDVGMKDKMGFIHTDDIQGKGTLTEKVQPKQKLIVQVVKKNRQATKAQELQLL